MGLLSMAEMHGKAIGCARLLAHDGGTRCGRQKDGASTPSSSMARGL